jgi:hypothetical protein
MKKRGEENEREREEKRGRGGGMKKIPSGSSHVPFPFIDPFFHFPSYFTKRVNNP